MSFVGYGYSQGVQNAIAHAYDSGVIMVNRQPWIPDLKIAVAGLL